MNLKTDLVPSIRCPSCGIRMRWSPENKFRPFCSERCKLIDLGQWATERYCVVGESVRDEFEMPVTQEN
jgi:hypothetical protein